jgi:CRP/FNR family transcriptional regulator, cyclic AMP receptor protein
MSDDALVQSLAAVDLFAGLPEKVLKRIATEGSRKKFAPGAAITEEGSSVSGWAPFSPEGVCFYVVLDGSAEVEVRGEQRATLDPGQYFGETSLIDGEPRSATVLAGPNGVETFALSAWAFAPILEQNPQVAIGMLKVVVKRLRAAEARS